MEVDRVVRSLCDGDFVVMVTDGVLDALPVGEQEVIMKMIIDGTSITNPKEMAHHILEQVLECYRRDTLRRYDGYGCGHVES